MMLDQPRTPVTIEQLVKIHDYLSTIPNPSEAIKEAIANLEKNIVTICKSFQTMEPTK